MKIVPFSLKLRLITSSLRDAENLYKCVRTKTEKEGDDNIKLNNTQVNCNWKVTETVLEHVQ